MNRRWAPAIAALAIALASCSTPTPPAIDAAPADSTAIALIDLTALRAAPVYGRLPAALRGLAEPLREAGQLMLAWNGTGLLLVARGTFQQPPAGYTSIGRGIAAAGAPPRIEAARRGLAAKAGAPLALPPGNAEIRAAVGGDGKLPLTGNLANAAILLHMANLTTVTVRVENSVEVEIAAQCTSPGEAVKLAESLRAIVTLAAAETRDADVAALLKSIDIARENIVVRVRAAAGVDALTKALGTP